MGQFAMLRCHITIKLAQMKHGKSIFAQSIFMQDAKLRFDAFALIQRIYFSTKAL